jgi:conjugative transfer signal peptidase TraF
MKNQKHKFFLFISLLFIILFIILIFWLKGYRYNSTPSLPIGWYKLTPIKNHTKLLKNTLIAFCPPATQAFEKNNFDFVPKNGICQNGYKILFKKIVGVENDVVEVNNKVFINGQLIKNSIVQIHISNGISFSPCFGKHILKKDKFFVMSDFNLQSFDSRYFCEINRSDILGVVKKL